MGKVVYRFQNVPLFVCSEAPGYGKRVSQFRDKGTEAQGLIKYFGR